jgi:hypothetical protein
LYESEEGGSHDASFIQWKHPLGLVGKSTFQIMFSDRDSKLQRREFDIEFVVELLDHKPIYLVIDDFMKEVTELKNRIYDLEKNLDATNETIKGLTEIVKNLQKDLTGKQPMDRDKSIPIDLKRKDHGNEELVSNKKLKSDE